MSNAAGNGSFLWIQVRTPSEDGWAFVGVSRVVQSRNSDEGGSGVNERGMQKADSLASFLGYGRGVVGEV